jgi:putative membrane protein
MELHTFRLSLAFTLIVVLPASSWAADPPPSAEVLNKLHQSNLKEIQMGQLAQKNAQSREVKAFGQTLVKDHTAADRKVKALAKQEKAELADQPAPMDHGGLGTGAEFDMKFAQSMLEDHKKDVDEAKAARDTTADPKLKSLLTELVPTLEKHRDTAQTLADAKGK